MKLAHNRVCPLPREEFLTRRSANASSTQHPPDSMSDYVTIIGFVAFNILVLLSARFPQHPVSNVRLGERMQEISQPGADTLPREEFLTRQSGGAISPTIPRIQC